jgi:hypothetical protein
MLRAGFEPATCRCEVDNRICAGPQQVFVAVVMRGRTAVSKPRGLGPSYHEITEPLRPATNRLARIRTRTSEVGARCASSYTTEPRRVWRDAVRSPTAQPRFVKPSY